MNKIKPEIINIYNEYGISDDDSDYDELDIDNTKLRRPSEIISNDINNYETNSDSSDENIYYQIRENSKKKPENIKKSITNLTNRAQILPDPIKKTFINMEKSSSKKNCNYYLKKILCYI